MAAMRREEQVRECLDGPLPAVDLAASLADIERLNERFGGHALTVREIARRLATVPRGHRAIVVDVGGGRGDLARHLVTWARRAGRVLRVIVVERDAATAALARAHCADVPEITVIQGDATALPLAERSVDVAVSVLTLHHLDRDAAVTALADMRTAARRAVVVNDLLRTRLSWLMVWLATRVFARHPVSRHDGPLSVRRAYDAGELRVLAEKAGLETFRIRRVPWLARLVLVAA
jgi:ubiquinone/menaquinone biosynthesis C-methylase UbiE